MLDLGLELGIDGFLASAVGRLPVGDNFALFAKLGFASYDVEVDLFGLESASDSQTDLAYGLGAALSFAEHWEVRLEYEAIDMSDGDFDMTSVSGLYRF